MTDRTQEELDRQQNAVIDTAIQRAKDSAMGVAYWHEGTDGYWVTFYRKSLTKRGTLKPEGIVGTYGTEAEAKAAIRKERQ